jgi:hypothetical protein
MCATDVQFCPTGSSAVAERIRDYEMKDTVLSKGITLVKILREEVRL